MRVGRDSRWRQDTANVRNEFDTNNGPVRGKVERASPHPVRLHPQDCRIDASAPILAAAALLDAMAVLAIVVVRVERFRFALRIAWRFRSIASRRCWRSASLSRASALEIMQRADGTNRDHALVGLVSRHASKEGPSERLRLQSATFLNAGGVRRALCLGGLPSCPATSLTLSVLLGLPRLRRSASCPPGPVI